MTGEAPPAPGPRAGSKLVRDAGRGAMRAGGRPRRLAPARRRHFAIVNALLVACFTPKALFAGLDGGLGGDGDGVQSGGEQKRGTCRERYAGFHPDTRFRTHTLPSYHAPERRALRLLLSNPRSARAHCTPAFEAISRCDICSC